MVMRRHLPHVPSFEALAEISPVLFSCLSYLLTFVAVAIYWVNHHNLIYMLEHGERGEGFGALAEACTFFSGFLWQPFVAAVCGGNYFSFFAVASYKTMELYFSGRTQWCIRKPVRSMFSMLDWNGKAR